MEKISSLLEDLDDFLTKFNDTFGETERGRMATIKHYLLQQGSYLASIYIADFRQLACDVDWDDNALISAFRWGLMYDVKDLRFNLPNPLTKAITQVVRCDNRLFERQQERRLTQRLYKTETITPWKQVSTNGSKPKPMQIDSLSFKKLLQKARGQRCKEGLCLYCGRKNHQARDFPYKSFNLETTQGSKYFNEYSIKDIQPH